ncbi:MAG TPA: hypothetical protein VL977_02555 [Solirubrobacteraceae bacterium]|nr:hypothetical protein [Solirubrobacteraceae bacterium]
MSGSASLPAMHRLRRTISLALLTLAAAPALAAAHPVVGIADNNTEMFADPRFLALGITQVRDDIAWNAVFEREPSLRLAAWLAAAKATGMTPLITFDHDIGSVRTQRRLPSVARFSRAFLALRREYPWVTQFVTWDEANFYLEGTSTDPARAVAYYRALRRDCRSCTIVAPDLLDVPRSEGYPMTAWARRFIRLNHGQPSIWGLNNYVGANRLQTRTTRQLLHAVRGQIWFTETGGIVARRNHSSVGFPQNARHAAKVDRFILTKLAGLSGRIRRVYLYDWNVARGATWDSALISWNGQPRPGYDVLANTLDAWGISPNCSISTVPPACSSG